MNPSILDVVAAFEAEQAAKLTAEKQAADLRAKNEAAVRAEASRRLLAIVDELQPAFDRLANPRRRDKAIVEHVFDDTQRTYWTAYDHKVVLCLSVRALLTGDFEYGMGVSYRDPNPFKTADPTEFKVKLAQWLGVKLANSA